MVATRQSLPTAVSPSKGADPTNDASPESDPKVKAALRKLQIDGTAALSGETVSIKPQSEQTYHWRGTTYVVSAGTKPEWVDNQPERYKKRQAGETRNHRHTYHGAVTNTRPHRVAQTDGVDDASKNRTSALRKRKRDDSIEDGTTPAEEKEVRRQFSRAKRSRRVHSLNVAHQRNPPIYQDNILHGIPHRRPPYPLTAGPLNCENSQEDAQSSEGNESSSSAVSGMFNSSPRVKNTRTRLRTRSNTSTARKSAPSAPTTSQVRTTRSGRNSMLKGFPSLSMRRRNIPSRLQNHADTRIARKTVPPTAMNQRRPSGFARKSAPSTARVQQVQATSDGRRVLRNLIQLAQLNTEVDKLRAAYAKNQEQLEKVLSNCKEAPNTPFSTDRRQQQSFSPPPATHSEHLSSSNHRSSTSHATTGDRRAHSPAFLHSVRDIAVSQSEFAMDGVSKLANDRPISTRHDSPTSNALTPPYPSRETGPTIVSHSHEREDDIMGSANDEHQNYTVAPPCMEEHTGFCPSSNTTHWQRQQSQIPRHRQHHYQHCHHHHHHHSQRHDHDHDHDQQTPRWSLSSYLGNSERAEAHINRDRVDGESQTARRSRVRREMQLVRGWEME